MIKLVLTLLNKGCFFMQMTQISLLKHLFLVRITFKAIQYLYFFFNKAQYNLHELFQFLFLIICFYLNIVYFLLFVYEEILLLFIFN